MYPFGEYGLLQPFIQLLYSENIGLKDRQGHLADGTLSRVSGQGYWKNGQYVVARGDRENLCLYSEDLTQGQWVKNGTTADDETHVTFYDQYDYILQAINPSVGGYFIISFEARNIDGNSNIQLDIGKSGATLWDGHAVSLSSSLQKYSFLTSTYYDPAEQDFRIRWRDENPSGHGTMELTNVQVEKLEGPVDAPGPELVTNGDCSADSFGTQTGWTYDSTNEEYDCDGSQTSQKSIYQNIALLKNDVYLVEFEVKNYSAGSVRTYLGDTGGSWRSANGVFQDILFASGDFLYIQADADFIGSVDNISAREITFAGPAEPGPYTKTTDSPMPIPADLPMDENGWYLHEGEVTNECIFSRSPLDRTQGSATINQDKTGIDGEANKAWEVIDDDSSSTLFDRHIPPITIPDDSNTHCVSFFVKKDEDETRYPSVYVKLQNGTTEILKKVFFSTKTGAKGSGFDPGAWTVEDYGSWWKLSCVITNNSSGNNELVSFLSPAASTDINASSNNASATGSIVVDAVQIELNKSHPGQFVETSGSPVTKTTAAADGAGNGLYWTLTDKLKQVLSDSVTNGVGKGTMVCEIMFGYDALVNETNYPGSMLTPQSSNYTGFAQIVNKREIVQTKDSDNNESSVNFEWEKGDKWTYCVYWDSEEGVMFNSVKSLSTGAWTTAAAEQLFSGAFYLESNLLIGYEIPDLTFIRNIRFFDEPLTQSEIEERF